MNCSPRILVVGDSLMVKQAGALRESSIYMAATTFVPMMFPSAVSAKAAIIQYMSAKFDVLYIDFGALHMLHIHPVRPFSVKPYKIGYTADIIAFLYLESWMKAELDIYKKAARKIVIMTPNRVCESKFYGEYEYYMNNSHLAISKCVEWFESIDEGTFEKISADRRLGPSVFGNLSDSVVRRQVCQDSLFNGRGSFLLAERMKRVVLASAIPLGLVDSYELTTAMGCNHTLDGRHYSEEVMVKRLTEFKEVVQSMNMKSGDREPVSGSASKKKWRRE